MYTLLAPFTSSRSPPLCALPQACTHPYVTYDAPLYPTPSKTPQLTLKRCARCTLKEARIRGEAPPIPTGSKAKLGSSRDDAKL